MEIRTQQTKLANNFGKLLRDKFGKGPEAVHVTISAPYVLVYIKGFISAMEEVLLEQGQELTVKTTREYLMKSIDPEIKGQIKAITDLEIQHIYYDWNLSNQSGVFVAVGPELASDTEDDRTQYSGKEEVHQEIISISRRAEKAPTEVFSYRLSDRSLIVIRKGILVPIEKQLISLGFDEKLRVAKRQLEGDLLLNSTHFAAILNSEVQDVFVDWDFELDNSIISFIIKPNK
ncbi:Na-translocating system protein MpsC family protein [Bacillus sp. SCS-153A]|uniref:Na-translocating system protein MpsC family protein n=1 Tax=Rossellomorea sedimentorum TaxID=3115294 RepID=UPI0039063506